MYDKTPLSALLVQQTDFISFFEQSKVKKDTASPTDNALFPIT